MKRACGVMLVCLTCLCVSGFAESLPTVRFSLPPVLEALPVAFAESWGLFEAHGISVDIVGLTDNQQRSIAFSANQLDGMFADISRTIYDASIGSDVLITSAATLQAQTDSLALALLSPAFFRYETLDDLLDTGQPIYTIFRSDYEYVLDHYLQDELGLNPRSVRVAYYNDLLQMAVWLGAQSLSAAMLPEPYVSYIETYYPAGGSPIDLNVLADLSGLGPLPTALVFRGAFVDEQPEVVEAFYAAYVEAIERINATPRDELIDEGIDIALGLFFQGADRTTINQEVLDALEIPYYDLPCPLDAAIYEDVLEWMRGKAYVMTEPPFEDISDFQFVQ